jgi:hypothetical protein
MAELFDVSARLAEGRPAVEDAQALASACHCLGSPDLTAEIREMYAGQEGLNLHALDADCAALQRAVAALTEATAQQDALAAAVGEAWQGVGADVSSDVLQQHADASRAAADVVRTAAEACARLRDELWRLVDAKAAAAAAIDEQIRSEWVAAAQTMETGAGDRSEASELVDRQVKPFVANDIGEDWLAAMRSTDAAVDRAFDAATADIGAGHPVAPGPAPAVEPAAAAPAAAMPSLPSLGGGMPDVGGGLSGFGQQLADLLGGLIGSSDDMGDPPDLEEPDLDDDIDDDEKDKKADEEADAGENDAEDDTEIDEPVEEPPPDAPPVEPPPAPVDPVEPVPTPVPAPPLPPADPAAAAETPCEIAATELPQVGE